MRKHSIFINQPDDFFFAGGSKTGMGYDENQYSLPRWRQLSISRAGMFDDLFVHLPTQGWMFVPITEYHAGGAEAIFAPLSQNLDSFGMALGQYLGAGVAACYRGNVPYDTEETKALVMKWITFYKNHRHTLIQPVVPLRRPNMQSWDGFLHVNPLMLGSAKETNEVGIAMIFNPLTTVLDNQRVYLPLYYTGADTTVMVSINEGEQFEMKVARDYSITVKLTLPPNSQTIIIVCKP